MHNDVYKNYLMDLGFLVKEYALEAKQDKEKCVGTPSEDFATGYLCGFHRIVTLMQQQAEGFQIPLEDLRLDDIDGNRDLI